MTKIFKAVFNSKKTQHPEGDKAITVVVEAKLKKQAETLAEQELAFWENEFHYLYKKPVMSEVEQSDLIEYLATKEKANQVDTEEIIGDSYQMSDSIDLIDIRNEMDSEDFPFNCGYYDTLVALYIAFGAKKSYTKKELKLIWMWLDNDEAVSVDISEDNRELVSNVANHYNEINDTSNNRIIIDEVFDLTKLAMSGEKQPVTIISQTGITIQEDNLSDDASNETGTTLSNDNVLLWAGYAPAEVSGADNTRYRIKSGAYILGTVIENDGLYNYESDKTAMTYAWGGTVDILLTEQSKNSNIKSIVDSAVSVVSKRKATEEFIKKQEIFERLAAMGYDCGQQEQESEIPEKVTEPENDPYELTLKNDTKQLEQKEPSTLEDILDTQEPEKELVTQAAQVESLDDILDGCDIPQVSGQDIDMETGEIYGDIIDNEPPREITLFNQYLDMLDSATTLTDVQEIKANIADSVMNDKFSEKEIETLRKSIRTTQDLLKQG